MHMLNLGILAHVDAGKTSLTERLLHSVGVIDEIGSVDDGNTQTDSLALERQRGITIKSAVVSFAVDDVTVNLIDTPGHPDFIAEVERVLSVLDGAVLVISAVEGVQAQTRVLMRTLRRLRIPTLVFVNKIDRGGACCERVLDAVAARLTRRSSPWARSGAGHARRALRPVRRAAARRSVARPALRARRRAARRVRRGSGVVRPDPRRSGAADRAGPGASGVLRLGRDGRGGGRTDRGNQGVAAARRGRCRRPGLGQRLQGRARARRGEDRLRADVLRDAADARPAASGRRRGGQGHRDQRLRPGCGGTRAVRGGGADRQALGPRGHPDRRHHRRTAEVVGRRAPLLAPDPRNRRRTVPSGRQGRTARRPHPIGRAGPPDRSAPGRDAQGDLRLALRRGAERGHPGDSGR
ncbi:GTP-binding protein [Streptomyces mirabilis]|nr:GTP-binding protein [Streptomyces mirabilis]